MRHVVLVTVLCATCCTAPPAPDPPVAVTRTLGTWQGRGSQTVGFVSDSGRLRISWQTSGESPPGAGTFRLALHSAVSGRPIEVIAEHGGEGRGVREVADDPRPYNLMVDSSDVHWTITVEEVVSVPARRP
jgi:hypothetical protein